MTNIPIMQVIDKLGLKYEKVGGGEYSLYEGGVLTDGWKFNTVKNIVHDFSKDRPQGDCFGFVKKYLGLEDKEVFQWFTDNFGTQGMQKPIMQVRNELQELNQQQIDYLKSRWIDYKKIKHIVRNYNQAIGCMVYENGIPKGLNARTLSKEKENRFIALSGYPTKGVYQNGIDKDKKYLIVVEGLIDFLSLRQFDTNVVGLKSAESGIEEIIKYSKDYQIYFVGDNDDAGRGALNKLQSIPYKRFPLEDLGDYKDINDAVISYEDLANGLIDLILDNSKGVSPIEGVFEKLANFQKIIKERGKLGFDGPIEKIYTQTSGIIQGSVYTIGAYSNTGKSKLSYQHIQYFLKQNKKCCLVSLEVSDYQSLMNIIMSADNKTQYDMIAGHKPTNQRIYNNLIIRDDIYTLDGIVEFVKSIDSEIVFIDFVQNIQCKGSSYERHANIAQTLQQLAIQTNKTIFNISQLSNSTASEMRKGTDTLPSLKGAGEYYASSDVVLIMHRDGDDTLLTIAKNKYGPNNKTAYIKSDFARNQFDFMKWKEEGF